ncbi:hypothetical protein OKA05_23910 [Luteolibacter arcticus]|uniref:DUF1559 domain-containing protein n=1 Tax=Luteolibacter arcticus TaxID=1581411 RepID=A0ABT3GQ66_9BACT|nr:hypothetical protein [Luteolibacter arcticus]MCW1925625.1 hypothetical protein [Luteolibacter arcticus]
MKRIYALGGLSICILVLFFLASLVTKRTCIGSDRTEAINNLKQLNLALIDFDHDYGCFPDAITAADVKVATGTGFRLGSSSSNELFRQLIASGNKSEKIFWASSAISRRKPDDVIDTDAKALAPGECAFTYIAGLHSEGDPDTPVLMVPVIRGTWKFDPKPFEGKALVLRLDGTVRVESINKHGHVMIGGRNLFDPRQPYWHGKAPDIKWPE